MEHVVFSPGPDGTPGFRRFSSLDEAVGFVEHLRNVEGVEDVSVHALTPVPVAFRAYYKVEVPVTGFASLPELPELPELPVQPVQPVAEEAPMESDVPVDVPVEANGKRSLGFFAH